MRADCCLQASQSHHVHADEISADVAAMKIALGRSHQGNTLSVVIKPTSPRTTQRSTLSELLSDLAVVTLEHRVPGVQTRARIGIVSMSIPNSFSSNIWLACVISIT